MKYLACLIAVLLLGAADDAQAKNKSDNNKAAQQKKAEEEKKREEREAKRDAINKYLAEKDTRHDGSVSKEEFLVGETDVEAASKKFDQYDKNRSRALEKTEIATMLGL